jgi:hypothetical protein
MLREYPAKQVPGDYPRRWFADDYFDLFVWFENNGAEIYGFQLCYDKCGHEKAITWKRDGTLRHEGIDTGEDEVWNNQSPILVAARQSQTKHLRPHFESRAQDLPVDIRDLVRSKIEEALQVK